MILKGAKKGEVVTCITFDSSQYLNIGHIKEAVIAYHYAQAYDGKMIIRFEDTNPQRSREEFIDPILEDLQSLNIKADKVTYTSDHFDDLLNIMTYLIKQGKCYCDNTDRYRVMHNRKESISSPYRDQSPEENQAIWEEMIKGQRLEYCVRAKGDMFARNKFFRDPVLYRHMNLVHFRTRAKYKVYPTYDFACPIVDSLEGATHSIRSNRNVETIEFYNWILEMCHLRQVTLCQISIPYLAKTSISQRKLGMLMHEGSVEGWDDPRLSTVRSILRRGIQVPTLVEFMLEQALCRSNHREKLDKIFLYNVKYIEPIAGRYIAISKKRISTMVLIDSPYTSDYKIFDVPLHPKNPNMGTKPQYRCNEMYVDYEDAINLKIGEKFTLMNLSNAAVESIEEQGDSLLLKAKLLEEDKDFKITKKISWLPKFSVLQPVVLIKYNELFAVDEIDLQTPINPQSKIINEVFADPEIKNLKQGSVVQFERMGYFIVDRVTIQGQKKHIEFIYIPNGKTKKVRGFAD